MSIRFHWNSSWTYTSPLSSIRILQLVHHSHFSPQLLYDSTWIHEAHIEASHLWTFNGHWAPCVYMKSINFHNFSVQFHNNAWRFIEIQVMCIFNPLKSNMWVCKSIDFHKLYLIAKNLHNSLYKSLIV